MSGKLSLYGRTHPEWAALVSAAHRFLIDQARQRRTTTYTELNAVLARRTSVRAFDFDLESERAAMGELLGRVVDKELSRSGHMISALVIYLNENDAGSGFYKLAQGLGRLPANATSHARTQFWLGEVKAVHAYYAGP